MAEDYSINPMQVPDDEEQRRRALLTMPPAGFQPISPMPRGSHAMDSPITNLILGRDSAALSTMPPGSLVPIRSRDLLMRTGEEVRGVPLPQPANAQPRGVALGDQTMPAVPMPMEREPGSGLVLRGRALAQNETDTNGSAASTDDSSTMPPAASVPIASIAALPTSRPGLQPLGSMPRPLTELQRLQQNGPGVSRLHGPLGVLARIGDVAGSVVAPNVMAAVPGTTLHNILLQNRAAGAERNRLATEDTQSQIDERKAQARAADARAGKPENIDQEYADAVTAEIERGDDSLADPKVQRIAAAARQIRGGPTNDFELWREQNPNAPVSDWLKLQQGAKPQRFASPFEAHTYGSPEERQAAQDFIDFEDRTRTKNQRPEKPGEVEQRYQLYLKNPEAYKAMYGDRGAAQDAAQATRMLNYFKGQRQQIENDWTIDEATRQQRLSEIEELERPYLDIVRRKVLRLVPGRMAPARLSSSQARPCTTGRAISERSSEFSLMAGSNWSSRGHQSHNL